MMVNPGRTISGGLRHQSLKIRPETMSEITKKAAKWRALVDGLNWLSPRTSASQQLQALNN